MIQRATEGDWDVNSVPEIHLCGSSYEIGYAHGSQLREQIHAQLVIYEGIFLQNCKFSWEQVRAAARQYQPAIQKLAPHLFEEMRGIVDGVNSRDASRNIEQSSQIVSERHVDILDVVALNARSEIALGQFDDGCTALAWNIGDLTDGEKAGQDPERRPKRRVLAQNWDWRTSVGPNLVLASIEQESKPTIWMVMEPGIVGKIGFNSASLGVCLNAIRAKPVVESLLPVHVILRLLLEQKSFTDALELISTLGGCASSQHILLSSPFGSRSLELSPLGTVHISEDSLGLIVHTNHFLENRLVDEPPWLSGSPVRFERARQLCAGLVEEYGKDKVREKLHPKLLRQRVFADTYHSPQAICCVPDPCREESVETLFNIVMMFEEGKAPYAEVTFGRPTRSDAKVYRFPS
ncbi:AAT-domain-containing protein [Phanerochaete sordida]|uniref:AAT-domain-containing protein n=1 Tax=Phanerochaete sordida TaxID=48140 RepID=A0A9P3LL10_9APHY|nr:AAT-domain-containing protein [Phanerochaete sordida]